MPNGDRLLLYIGIIDILQHYTLKKKIEHHMKSVIWDGDTVSVHKPSFYKERFIKFMELEVFTAKKYNITKSLGAINSNSRKHDHHNSNMKHDNSISINNLYSNRRNSREGNLNHHHKQAPTMQTTSFSKSKYNNYRTQSLPRHQMPNTINEHDTPSIEKRDMNINNKINNTNNNNNKNLNNNSVQIKNENDQHNISTDENSDKQTTTNTSHVPQNYRQNSRDTVEEDAYDVIQNQHHHS